MKAHWNSSGRDVTAIASSGAPTLRRREVLRARLRTGVKAALATVVFAGTTLTIAGSAFTALAFVGVTPVAVANPPTTDSCGYSLTANPVFNENTVTRAALIQGTGLTSSVHVITNDESGMLLGVNGASADTGNSTAPFYTDVTNPSLGDNTLDAFLRPQYPALFVTDITSNLTSKAGDWQSTSQARQVSDGVITSGSPNFSSATAAFTLADVGSLIGDGSSKNGIPTGTTIITFTDASHVVMSNNATASGTGDVTTISKAPVPRNLTGSTPFADGVGGSWATATQSGSTYTAVKPSNKNDWNFGPMSPEAPWRQITDATTTSGSHALSTTHNEFSASDVGMLIDDAHGSGVIPSGTTISAFTDAQHVTLSAAATGSHTNDSVEIGTFASNPLVTFASLGSSEGYGADVGWNVSGLTDSTGTALVPGHTYRFQVMTHDGDQNKTGGDVGEFCTNLTIPRLPATMSTTLPEGLAANGITVGSSTTDTATVTGSGSGGFPSGDVTFSACKESSPATPCTSGGTLVGTVGPTPSSTSGTNVSIYNLPAGAFTPPSVGTWCFLASYAGDDTYNPLTAASNTECFSVNPATPTFSTTAAITGSVVFGANGTIADTATVNGTAVPGHPTGNVQFFKCGPSVSNATCSTPLYDTESLSQIGSSADSHATSASFTPSAAGTYCFGATYVGDTNYTSVSDNISGDPVALECVTIQPPPTIGTTAAITGSVVIGANGTISDTATVNGTTPPGHPTGNVQFFKCGPSVSNATCSTPLYDTESLSQIGSSADSHATSASFTPSAAGTYCFGATYVGDTNYPSISDNISGDPVALECVTIQPGPTISTTAAITGSVVLGANGTISDTATVNGTTPPGHPTGNVQFFKCGPSVSNATCSTPLYDTESLSQIGSSADSHATSASFTPSAAGTYCFGATYVGDTNYPSISDNISGDPVALECVTIQPGPTISTTAAITGSVVLGANGTISDTATVNGTTPPGHPTGNVQFFKCGPSVSNATCSTPLYDTESLSQIGSSADSHATSASFTPSAAGTYCFGATYVGDTNYPSISDNISGDPVALECVTIQPGPTISTTAAITGSVVLGANGTISDTATVNGTTPPGHPTGNVQFFKCGPSVSNATCSTPLYDTESLSQIGSSADSHATSASFTPSAAGTYCFGATYVGDTNYPSVSDNISGDPVALECVTIQPGPTISTTAAITGSVVLGANGTISDTATVNGTTPPGHPTGNVQFFKCGPSVSNATCSTPLYDTESLSQIGSSADSHATSASFTPSAAGTYCFGATYVGDTNYPSISDNISGDPVALECVTIQPGPTISTTAAITGSVVLGANGTISDTATVNGTTPPGHPTGNVQFFKCGPSVSNATCSTPLYDTESLSQIGSSADSHATSASFTPSAAGTYCFGATYVGDTNYPSISDNISGDPVALECVTIQPGPTISTTAAITGSVVIGANGTISDTATVNGTTPPGHPTGNVQFFKCGPSVSNATCSTPLYDTESLSQIGSSADSHATSASFTPSAAGTYCFGATYVGDTNYPSISDNISGDPVALECVTIQPGPTISTTAAITGSVVLGANGTISDTATVNGTTPPGHPTGNVQFFKCGPSVSNATCSTPLYDTESLSQIGSSADSHATSASFTPSAAGTYCFGATYVGDTNYPSISDNISGDPVALECVTIQPGPTISTTAAITGSVVLGANGTISDTATVNGTTPPGHPTGNVQFFKCGPSVSNATCSTPLYDTESLSQIGSSADSHATSASFTPSAAGTYCFGATYVGDTNYPSISDNISGDPVALECVTIQPGPTISTTAAITGSVVLGANGTISDTATVNGTTPPGHPTGNVQFFKCGPSVSNATCSTPLYDTESLSQIGSSADSHATSASFTPSAAGTYCFGATYVGDTNYPSISDNISGDPVALECVTIQPGPTISTTAAITGSVVLGANGTISDTATVNGTTPPGHPTGNVQFFKCGPSVSNATCSTPLYDTESLSQIGSSADSHATSASFTPSAAGTYCFGATYVGDTNYPSISDNISGDPVALECVTIQPGPTISTTAAITGSVVLGANGTISDTATVNGTTPPGHPTGNVQFFKCGPSVSNATCSTPLYDTESLSQIGSSADSHATSASFTPSAAGTYCFGATYVGDTNYPSISDNISGDPVALECVTIEKGPSTTVTQQSGSQTGPGTILLGGSVTDSATVSSTASPPGPTPSGTVTFYVCGPAVSFCAANTGNQVTSTTANPNPATLDNGGMATSAAFTPNATGTWCFSAVYSGDSNYVGSSDNTTADNAATNECVLVTAPNFSIHKTDVPGDTNPVVPGSTIPYTVVISNTGDGAGSAVITDTLPSNLTLVASSPAPHCPATLPESCTIGVNGQVLTFTVTIAAASSLTATFSAVVSANDTADVVNTAAITTGTCTGENACTSTVTNPVPDFSVHKVDGPGDGTTVEPGQTIPYTVTVTNVGDGAGSAVITDTLPPNLTITGTPSCATTGTTGDACTLANPSGSTWTYSVTLAPGDTATVTYSAVVAATDTTDEINTATVTSGPCNQLPPATSAVKAHDTTVTCQSTVDNPVAILSAVKSSTPASGSTVALGSTVTYGLTLTNAGTADATGITMSDAIPNGTTYVASSATCGGAPGCTVTEANNTVTWTGITVHPGTANAVALSFKVTVNASDTNGEVIPNFAVFTNVGTPGCTTATCNTNTVTVTVSVPASAPAVVTAAPVPPPPPPVVKAATIAFTGADIAGMVTAGLAFLGLGGLLVVLSRRRRRTGETGV